MAGPVGGFSREAICLMGRFYLRGILILGVYPIHLHGESLARREVLVPHFPTIHLHGEGITGQVCQPIGGPVGGFSREAICLMGRFYLRGILILGGIAGVVRGFPGGLEGSGGGAGLPGAVAILQKLHPAKLAGRF